MSVVQEVALSTAKGAAEALKDTEKSEFQKFVRRNQWRVANEPSFSSEGRTCSSWKFGEMGLW